MVDSSPDDPPRSQGIGSDDIAARKAALRRTLRAARRTLVDQPARSATICDLLIAHHCLAEARSVLVYDPVPGEPDLGALASWCRRSGIAIAVPEEDPDPLGFDVVIVPGVAFCADGRRLGQGGGWYDRFLPRLRPDAVTIGVCFAECLVDDLPVEAHDRRVDHVVTERGGIAAVQSPS